MEYCHKNVLILFIFCCCFPAYFSIGISKFRHLEVTSKITIKVSEKGEQNVLSESFKSRPDQVLIDGKEVNLTDFKVTLENENSVIELIWNEPIKDCHEMFLGLSNICDINFKDFDTSQVTDMSCMFGSCSSIEALDLTSFKTSKVKNMSGMFQSCDSLTKLNISNFDTSEVTDTSFMFDKCQNLLDLDVSSFKTTKVTNMAGMFQSCVKIKKLDISNFDTSSVTNMRSMFHSCTCLESLDLSKFKTSNVKNMFGMFASLSLNYLNLSSFDISDTTDISYLFYDSNILLLDLSNFLANSLLLYDNVFEYTPILKYINLRNYKGSDIFDSVESNELTICRNESLSEETKILEQKNIINNCSDMCFYEFNKIREDKEGCEIDCDKIEDERNEYYLQCNPKNDSSIFTTINQISSTQPFSTINKYTTIESNEVKTILSTTVETTKPENPTISTILSTNINQEQTIISTKPEITTIVTNEGLNITSTDIETNSKTTIIPSEYNETTETNNETTSELTETITETTSESTETTEISTNEITETTTIAETTDIESTSNGNSTDSPLKIMIYGYQNYRFINNVITFKIYFILFDGYYPRNVYFTLFIFFSNYMRYLDDSMNVTSSCSFNEENDKLLSYNCEAKPEKEISLTNATVNYDFDFQAPYELYESSQALYNKDKLHEQTGDLIGSKHIIYLKGDLTQDDNYFRIKGTLDKNYQIDKTFNLTVYDNQNSIKNISCETEKEIYNDFEIKCSKNELYNIDVNNTVSYMTSSQMLVIINEGQNTIISQTSENTESPENPNSNHLFYGKNKKSSLSAAIIVVIVIVIVVVLMIVAGILIKYRKKIFNKGIRYETKSDSNFNLGVNSYDNNNIKDY